MLYQLIEVPRHTSKILSTTSKTPAANTLIGEFDRKNFTGAGDTYLKKADKKDLSKLVVLYCPNLESAMVAEDWETKYREAWDQYRVERENTTELKVRMSTKQ